MIYLKKEERKNRVKNVTKAALVLSKVKRVIFKTLDITPISGEELNKIAYELIVKKYGARPSFLGYKGFPASICLSVNEEIIHGIPFNKIVKECDIVTVDVGVEWKGYHADSAFTRVAGKSTKCKLIDNRWERKGRLMKTVIEALEAGISQAKVGNYVSDISTAIEEVVKSGGYFTLSEYGGHGIGKKLHQTPLIPNVLEKSELKRVKLIKDMTICIEPIVIEKNGKFFLKKDGWTVVTEDKDNLSAHSEHTVLVGSEGGQILTIE